MIALLTKGDRLSPNEKEKKLANIKASLLEIENKKGYTMEIVEWSNEHPLPNQEEKLSDAIEKLDGFDPMEALEAQEKEIEDEVEKLYNAKENITIIKHAAKQDLEEFKVDREVEENLVVQCDEVVEKVIPVQKETRTLEIRKMIHFNGEFGPDSNDELGGAKHGFTRLGGIIGTNYLVCGLTGREEKTQTKQVEFPGKVISVRFDKSADDVHLLDELNYTIDPSPMGYVTVTAKFSWGGSVVMTWDFDLKVTATVEDTVVVKEEYRDKIVVPKQRIEAMKKIVTDIDKRMVEVAPAYEQKIYKRTKEEIKKSIIDDQILRMT
ncbi:unnamed protein product [Adineta steineri]|uniref:Uncharacterized protein n=1 Tax=Adineta steineri TaxID=433720 RepID=A0A819FJD1_9BILA|nr:unnamed protein product [Adineta steineri]CAF3869525.1 unnamed protein product [Adineta steineri]